MSRRFKTFGLRAGFWAVLFAATAMAVEPPDHVVLIDGMAVDLLVPGDVDALRFRAALPSLSAGGPGTARRLLLDAPEPLRDPAGQRQVVQHLEQSDRLSRRGQFRAALLELRDGLALDPGNPVLLSRAASHASSLRDFEQAAGYFQRFLEVQPQDTAHLAGYAAVLLRLARFDEAERLLARVAESQPDSLVLRFNQLCLDLLRERGDFSPGFWRTRPVEQLVLLAGWIRSDREALVRLIGRDDFERLCDIVLGPGIHARLDALGAELQALQDAGQAGDKAATARTLGALRALGIQTLGIEAALADMEFRGGNPEAALAAWQAMVRDQPDWLDARFNLGLALFRTERFSESVSVFREALTRGDPPVLRFVLAAALAMSGEHDEPRDLFTELVRSHPDEVRQWLGSEAAFQTAMRRMNNYQNLLRRLGIPPELE